MLSAADVVWIDGADQECSVCGRTIHVRDAAYSKDGMLYCSKNCEHMSNQGA